MKRKKVIITILCVCLATTLVVYKNKETKNFARIDTSIISEKLAQKGIREYTETTLKLLFPSYEYSEGPRVGTPDIQDNTFHVFYYPDEGDIYEKEKNSVNIKFDTQEFDLPVNIDIDLSYGTEKNSSQEYRLQNGLKNQADYKMACYRVYNNHSMFYLTGSGLHNVGDSINDMSEETLGDETCYILNSPETAFKYEYTQIKYALIDAFLKQEIV